MADETAKLILAVDSTSAKTATADLDKLTESSAKAEAESAITVMHGHNGSSYSSP